MLQRLALAARQIGDNELDRELARRLVESDVKVRESRHLVTAKGVDDFLRLARLAVDHLPVGAHDLDGCAVARLARCVHGQAFEQETDVEAVPRGEFLVGPRGAENAVRGPNVRDGEFVRPRRRR